MTRHFLRDKNGEEMELPSGVAMFRLFGNRRRIIWHNIEFRENLVRINQKLEFVVWEEV